MGHNSLIGEFEQMVLLSILQLGDQAFAPGLAQFLENSIDRRVSRGALYSCLNQLDTKGFLDWELEPPVSVRDGHSRRKYRVTPEGIRALQKSRAGLMTLWNGLEELLH